MEELTWDWKFQLLKKFTAQGNIWTDWTNCNKTAKGTLCQEDEGISIDGQKMKRKSAKKQKN